MPSSFAKVLVAVVAISSFGVALAHTKGLHVHAPAPAPSAQSAAAGFLPATMVTSLIVAINCFVAARCL
ncbi:hypothetical protein Mapa_006284 [Marchantia paleacea]|nr:hypothetical protein Mapa_006284 [Marchantia paleacea]